MPEPGTTTWWAVIDSDGLLDYLRQAHNGDDPSEVLARLYLDADERENVRPAEVDEDLEGERMYRRDAEIEAGKLRQAARQFHADVTRFHPAVRQWITAKALEAEL